MAQAGYTPISLYYSTTASATPTNTNLVNGELAININSADMALYAKNDANTVIRIMNNPASLKYPTSDGTNGQAMVTNGAGVLSWTTITSGATITNDTSTSSDLYPSFLAATTGSALNIYTSNAKLLYKPSTGELKASEMVATNGLMVNSTTVSASYTIATGTNAMSVGPITVASGQNVTVSSGQRWVVI